MDNGFVAERERLLSPLGIVNMIIGIITVPWVVFDTELLGILLAVFGTNKPVKVKIEIFRSGYGQGVDIHVGKRSVYISCAPPNITLTARYGNGRMERYIIGSDYGYHNLHEDSDGWRYGSQTPSPYHHLFGWAVSGEGDDGRMLADGDHD